MSAAQPRIATIDGLRGVAIILVVWFHTWQITWLANPLPLTNLSLQPLAETGFLGVALFFFISGFVIVLPFARARNVGGAAPSMRHFASRRFAKIFPSYALCIVAMLAIGYQTYPSANAAIKDVVFHLLFIHDWFATTTGTIDGVMWSLGVEVQFYLLFPLIVFAFVRRPLLTTLALFAVANGWRVWCLLSSHYFFEQRLEQLPAYIDDFAAGMFAAYLFVVLPQRAPRLAARRWFFSALMLVGIVASLTLINDCYAHRYDPEWPSPWSVAWRSSLALAFAATALGALFAHRPLQSLLANRALLFLAAISYNLYLWHQPIARKLLAWHIPPYATADPKTDPHWQIAFTLIAVAAALAFSAAVTFGFEQPLLRLRSHRRPRLIPSRSPFPENLSQ
jgi:peptidoglycan/LPS O-acetylase OafA/YrhL